MAFSESQVILD